MRLVHALLHALGLAATMAPRPLRWPVRVGRRRRLRGRAPVPCLGLVPTERDAKVVEAAISWDYTTFLNLALLLPAVLLVVRFVRDGNASMLRRMGGAPARA